MSGLTFDGGPDVRESAEYLVECGLSERQADVAALKQLDMSRGAIASLLSVDLSTVGTHEDRIRDKVLTSRRLLDALDEWSRASAE